MHKFLIVLFFFLSVQVMAQDSANTKSDTSSYSLFSSLNDSLNKAEEDKIFKETMEQSSRNLNSYLKYREQEKAHQNRNALIRIGLGIFFFIILVIGLKRQRKKRQ